MSRVKRLFQAEHKKFSAPLSDQPSDLEAARAFMGERFQKNDSTVFAIRDDESMLGFTQLFPSLSSVSMKRVWILNDLFVREVHRKKGAATLLMSAAENFARETGAVQIILSTQTSNIAARSLYQSLGYCKDENFCHYSLSLQRSP
ncbi:GNAT family N-acetyltransferase [Altericista sp. CCNU0014]|uniref:GNAT family N-acetyltransferase n=1 Tax=Altericista sp. CCNU0014 TaxID=3082949 RepID=UPI00384C71DB